MSLRDSNSRTDTGEEAQQPLVKIQGSTAFIQSSRKRGEKEWVENPEWVLALQVLGKYTRNCEDILLGG
jgi:hypothetical protein